MKTVTTEDVKAEAIRQLKLCQLDADTETAHLDADCAICLLLSRLGFSDVVDEYRKVKKWFS